MRPLKIEKNVPIPRKSMRAISWKSIAEEMAVGDSVKIKGKTEHETRCKVEALKTAMRSLGFKAIQRQMTRGNRTSYRVWRVL